jgi:hypothetical protein
VAGGLILHKQSGLLKQKRAKLKTFDGGHKYNCGTCYHKVNCKDSGDLGKVCKFWFSPNSKIKGLAYGDV